MTAKTSVSVKIISVCGASTNMIRSDEKTIKILKSRDYRANRIVNREEGLMSCPPTVLSMSWTLNN